MGHSIVINLEKCGILVKKMLLSTNRRHKLNVLVSNGSFQTLQVLDKIQSQSNKFLDQKLGVDISITSLSILIHPLVLRKAYRIKVLKGLVNSLVLWKMKIFCNFIRWSKMTQFDGHILTVLANWMWNKTLKKVNIFRIQL